MSDRSFEGSYHLLPFRRKRSQNAIAWPSAAEVNGPTGSPFNVAQDTECIYKINTGMMKRSGGRLVKREGQGVIAAMSGDDWQVYFERS